MVKCSECEKEISDEETCYAYQGKTWCKKCWEEKICKEEEK